MLPIPKDIIEDNLFSPEKLDDMPSPRVIKTHQLLNTLPPDLIKSCKVLNDVH